MNIANIRLLQCSAVRVDKEEYILSKRAMSLREARNIAQRIADDEGAELIDAELTKEPTGRYLRFYMDKGDGITLDELEALHRRLQPLVEDVEYDFMEVSSPGADRPLKTQRDFERAQGLEVELKTYKPVNGAKLFRGELLGLREGRVELISGGEMLSFEHRDVAIVRPVIEFTEEDLLEALPPE